jgi:porphobilinogen synthase
MTNDTTWRVTARMATEETGNTEIPLPQLRLRRLRRTPALRALVRETSLRADQLIAPLFIRHGRNARKPISAMPGHAQLSADLAVKEVEALAKAGIRAVLLFGIPARKDLLGSENYDPQGVIPSAIRAIKQAVPEMTVISDLCFCEYTTHGHCGLINLPAMDGYEPNLEEGYLLNDLSLKLLARASVVHAEAGADILAPSGMLDGMVAALRATLDAHHFQHIPIMSYAAKFASSLYGPFREAAEGAPKFGDRSQYQMDIANGREALREVAQDVAEGADVVIVKPAGAYLDIIHQVRARFDLPLAAYQVSGEYAMIKAAAANGWLDERRAAMESLLSIRRAGADMIITYFAKDAVAWL